MKNKTTSSIPTAAVYDRWLFTLGGGEQVAFAYAEVLRELGYKTSLLTHRPVDIKLAEKKMNIDLTDISIRYLPEQHTREISAYTEEYEVFINTSYLDYFPNRAKIGLLSVFFPGQIFLSPFEYIKRAFFIPSLQKFFIYPLQYNNFSYDEYRSGRIFKWLKPESHIIFNTHFSKIKLTFFCETISFSVLEQIHFTWGDKKINPIRKKLHHHENMVTFEFSLPSTEKLTLGIDLPNTTYASRIALLQLTIPGYRFKAYNIFKKYFPKWEMRLHGGPGITKRADIESYNEIVTISEFCKAWIRRYWGLGSTILYPPVNTIKFSPAKNKKPMIAHVGRFFVTGHCKKQLDLVKVFKKLFDQGKAEDWEMHFVGSIHDGEKHQQYYQQCVFEAKGYPIHFHTDYSFDQLNDLLSEASIYWHATGLDENVKTNPIAFEHFGITTVEAMASGCVPIVINKGGQPEIVTEGSGYVWESREDLLSYTQKLINDPELLKKMSKQAIERSRYFDKAEFKKRFKNILQSHGL